jgi:YD repeat-containing protein
LKNSDHTTLDSALYGYNAGNQRTTFTNAAGTYVQCTYDPIGQLKVADSATASEDRGYVYDAAWNLEGVGSWFWQLGGAPCRGRSGPLTLHSLRSKEPFEL